MKPGSWHEDPRRRHRPPVTGPPIRGTIVGVLHTIVEGEPGIFPDPVARVMRRIGGWFDRRRTAEPTGAGEPCAPATAPAADDDAPPPGGRPGPSE